MSDRVDYTMIKAMAKAEGLSVADLCALAPNNDPFYTGRPSEVAAATWFAQLWAELGFRVGYHLRRAHYQIVSQDPPILRPDGTPYENTERNWGYLGNASKWARYLDLVPIGALDDHRNPEAIIHARWRAAWERSAPEYTVSGDDWEDTLYQLPALPELDGLPDELPALPDFWVSGYDGVEQAYHVELWCEKTTMNDVLVPLCQRYGGNLITGAGELSIKSVELFMHRVREAARPARILYISDFDPAGLGMPISVARKIEFFQRERGFDDLDIRLHPIVLTGDQVAHYRLPRVPVKDSDKRKAHFEAAHGEGQVELDALEALYPGELGEIVEGAILQYYDPTLQERTREMYEEIEEDLSERREAVIASHQDDLDALQADYDALRADFDKTRERFREAVVRHQPEIDAYLTRLEEIKARGRDLYGAIRDDLDVVDLDGDDYALPDADLPNESDGLLYDSQRGYFEQLEAYKGQRDGVIYVEAA